MWKCQLSKKHLHFFRLGQRAHWNWALEWIKLFSSRFGPFIIWMNALLILLIASSRVGPTKKTIAPVHWSLQCYLVKSLLTKLLWHWFMFPLRWQLLLGQLLASGREEGEWMRGNGRERGEGQKNWWESTDQKEKKETCSGYVMREREIIGKECNFHPWIRFWMTAINVSGHSIYRFSILSLSLSLSLSLVRYYSTRVTSQVDEAKSTSHSSCPLLLPRDFGDDL